MRDERDFFLKGGVPEDVSKLEIPASPPNSTLDPTSIANSALAYVLNGSVYGGVFQAGRAYRLWGTGFTSDSTFSAATLASIASSSQCDRLVVLTRTATGFEFYNVNIANSTSAQGSVYGTAFGAFSQNAGTWMGYQHLDRAFFVGGVNGDVRQVQSLCGTASASIVYKTAQFPNSQVTTTPLATAIDNGYTSITFAPTGSPAYSYATMTAGATSPFGTSMNGFPANASIASGAATNNVAQYSNIELFVDGDWEAHDDIGLQHPPTNTTPGQIFSYLQFHNDSRKIDFAYTFTTLMPLASTGASDYLWVTHDATGANGVTFTGADVVATRMAVSVAVSSASTTWISLPIQIAVTGAGSKVLNVWADLTALTPAQRADIKRLRLTYWVDGTGSSSNYCGFIETNVKGGGKAYKLQSQSTDTLSAEPVDEELKYHVRYRSANGLTVSRLLSASVQPSVHEGFRPDSVLPKIGNRITITSLVAGAPWDSTSLIDVYREVLDRTTNTTKYFRIVDGAANTGSSVFADTYTDRELLDSITIPWTSILDPNGESLSSTTVQASGMVCGTSWKGANVLFDTGGLCYISRVGTYTEFEWPGIDSAIDPDDVSRARFLQITDDGLPVLYAKGLDALYMFSRNRPYAMTGEFPSSASRPVPLPNLGGILGMKAAHPWKRGIVYAAKDGLHYVFVPFGFNGTAEQVEHVELTKDNRGCWADYLLTGTDGSDISVAVDRNGRDIMVFNGAKALHIDTEAGVVRRTWATGDTVSWAGFNHKYGLLTIMATRACGVMGDFLTDGGTDVGGTNGTTFVAEFETKKFTDFAKLLRAQLWCRTPAYNTDITLTATSDRGGTQAITFTGENPVYNKAWPANGATSGGRWFKLNLKLNPGTIVEAMIVSATSHDGKRGL